ncbi:MAG: flavodoxin-dependent (E)-4-hydroxy-3-methylbut-2-enyl-diphosphate synthase [Nitrospiraceae bacterium]|nr:flavodoxin-dependent (E)-4-hydroxy-3-methylbut-2-enyl-diphosphate synthase [Nitrospiraceae bacterium]
MKKRRTTRLIRIGGVPVGGGSPVSIQSMTKTDTRDSQATLRQIRALKRAGCDIIRVAVPDMEAAMALGPIKKASPIPVIADIHFDWRLALEALRQGVDGLRINPGNIGADWKLKEVVLALKDRAIPVRVGVNAGSLEKGILARYGHPCAPALVESALRQTALLEKFGHDLIKVSLKASNVPTTVDAYRMFSEKSDYPLHIGISEAGPPAVGVVKSAVGLGVLLWEGIGDTMRVSLTGNPVQEVRTARQILQGLAMAKGPEIISCPTCGRTTIDIRRLASQVEKRLRGIQKPVKVAVMGCVVNGPGEASEADFGVTGSKGAGMLFKKGKVLKTVREEDLLDELMKEIGKWRP